MGARLCLSGPGAQYAPHLCHLSCDSFRSMRPLWTKRDHQRFVAARSRPRCFALQRQPAWGPSRNPQGRGADRAEPKISAWNCTDRESALASNHSLFRRYLQLDQAQNSGIQVTRRGSAIRIRTLHPSAPSSLRMECMQSLDQSSFEDGCI